MTMKKCETPFGYAIFCDDVRFENTGKQIYIGVYTHEMVIPSGFPVRLRSLAIIASLAERPHESKADIKFIVSYTGIEKPLAEITIAREELDKFPPPERESDDEGPHDPIMGVSAVFNLGDLNLPGPGKITVAAKRDSESIFVGRLKVSQGPIPEMTAFR